MNLFCLSIDGLQTAMLGAYGNAWVQTPALNHLASQSVVFDRFYAESLNLWDTFNELGQSFSALITDDSDVFLHPQFADCPKKYLLETPKNSEPANELEDTQFFKAVAASVDLLRKSPLTAHGSRLAVHLQGFRGIWDFPLKYREIHQDNEDPEPYRGVGLPKIGTEEEIDPDELQSVMEAYSGGIAVLDDAVAGLLGLLENGELGETMLILMGTRGFSLGEHGLIGTNADLYSENLHLPLLIRFPNQEYVTVRVPQLLQPKDLADFLRYYFSPLSERQGAVSELLQRIHEENTAEIHSKLFFRNENNETAVLTPDWFLNLTPAPPSVIPRLFVKPDDRFEFNDVADRRPDTVEELTMNNEQ